MNFIDQLMLLYAQDARSTNTTSAEIATAYKAWDPKQREALDVFLKSLCNGTYADIDVLCAMHPENIIESILAGDNAEAKRGVSLMNDEQRSVFMSTIHRLIDNAQNMEDLEYRARYIDACIAAKDLAVDVLASNL